MYHAKQRNKMSKCAEDKDGTYENILELRFAQQSGLTLCEKRYSATQ